MNEHIYQQPYWQQQREMAIEAWYPKIKDLVPTPKTEIVTDLGFKNFELVRMIDPEEEIDFDYKNRWDKMITKIEKAVQVIGSPYFIRTGLTSYKHNWDESCGGHGLLQHRISNLIEFSAIIDSLIESFAIREMLPTQPAFICEPYGNLPVNKERRYFIKDGKVKYHLPYWIKEAFEEHHNNIPKDWQERLSIINTEDDLEIETLTSYTEKVAQVMEGAWSVDWMYSTGNGWNLIDMAHADRSWGYDEDKINE